MIYKFVREQESWYIDLPDFINQGGSKADLLMVQGADDLLDFVALYEDSTDSVELELSNKRFPRASELKLDQICKDGGGGAWYWVVGYDNWHCSRKIWLCNVTLYVFNGKFPKTIYYKSVKSFTPSTSLALLGKRSPEEPMTLSKEALNKNRDLFERDRNLESLRWMIDWVLFPNNSRWEYNFAKCLCYLLSQENIPVWDLWRDVITLVKEFEQDEESLNPDERKMYDVCHHYINDATIYRDQVLDSLRQ